MSDTWIRHTYIHTYWYLSNLPIYSVIYLSLYLSVCLNICLSLIMYLIFILFLIDRHMTNKTQYLIVCFLQYGCLYPWKWNYIAFYPGFFSILGRIDRMSHHRHDLKKLAAIFNTLSDMSNNTQETTYSLSCKIKCVFDCACLLQWR